ncbi:MAG TPA: hypothetical protein VFC21_13010, partial [Bryobacteraceae bacterium]|nr:hypothetical protein [Bryobacteraceae bacterium]
GFHKNTALYRDLKKERKATLAAQPPAEASKPLAMAATAAAPAAGPVAQAPAESIPSSENGFVYANPEIAPLPTAQTSPESTKTPPDPHDPFLKAA